MGDGEAERGHPAGLKALQMEAFFFDGTAYNVVFFTVIAAAIWIVWKLGFNRE